MLQIQNVQGPTNQLTITYTDNLLCEAEILKLCNTMT